MNKLEWIIIVISFSFVIGLLISNFVMQRERWEAQLEINQGLIDSINMLRGLK